MSDNRPSPDEILKKIQATELQIKRGKLKLFLGASAGVGKTYTMLEEAKVLHNNGVDVVIGYIETHGRKGTLAVLSNDIEIIPLKTIEYKGSELKELNVDAVLRRNPKIVLIDELAHSNPPNSRNKKRYQDVEEILHAGIDVYSAVNIQHIESLNNIVEQITQIKVLETIPDSIVENADEIILIDVTPEELIQRLKDGKIYATDRVEKALSNFFRRGNLTALREIALRKTAEKVEKQVVAYRQDKEIDNIWANEDKLLLVLEPGYSGERIIRYAKNLASKGFSNWYVLCVETPDFTSKPLQAHEQVNELFRLANSLGAITVTVSGIDTADAVVEYAHTQNINSVLISQYRLPLYMKMFGKTLADRISEIDSNIHIHLAADDNLDISMPQKSSKLRIEQISLRKIFNKTIFFMFIFALTSIILLPLQKYLHTENILMLYLLVIVLVNRGRGKISAFISSFIAAISFDFCFIPPYFSFDFADLQYAITFLVMFIVAMFFGIINGNLRYQVTRLAKNEHLNALLAEFSSRMSSVMIESQVVSCVYELLPQVMSLKCCLLLPTLDEDLIIYESDAGIKIIDKEVANWVFSNGVIAGKSTDTFNGQKYLYLPIKSQLRSRGVLVVEMEHYSVDVKQQLERFLLQVANTLERIHFLQIATSTELTLAEDKLKNNILRNIVNYLKEPVINISNALKQIRDQDSSLLLSVENDLDNINSIVIDLDTLLRFQSGLVELNMTQVNLVKILEISSKNYLKHYLVNFELANDLPNMRLDMELIQRAFNHITDNIASYVPIQTEINIIMQVIDDKYCIIIEDKGPGISLEVKKHLFTPFVRSEVGTGLGIGLTLAKLIINAHGGEIKVSGLDYTKLEIAFSM